MITPDRVRTACDAYRARYGRRPRYLYVNWFDYDPLRYLLRDAIAPDGLVVLGPYQLRFALHQEVPRGQCVVTSQGIPSTYRRRDDGTPVVRAATRVVYPTPEGA